MQWFLDRKHRSGLFTAREFLIHLDNPLRYQVCQGATVNAFIYKALVDASFLAGQLGKTEEAGVYQQEAESLKTVFNRLMWDEKANSFYAAVYYPELLKDAKLPEPVWERTILIEPHPGDLLYARGVAMTEFGPVPVEWKREGRNSIHFSFEIPENTEAVIRLPKQGQQNKLNINGQTGAFAANGRFIEFRVTSGLYDGTVTAAN